MINHRAISSPRGGCGLCLAGASGVERGSSQRGSARVSAGDVVGWAEELLPSALVGPQGFTVQGEAGEGS